MIEARTQTPGEATQTQTPQTITVSMILNDLDSGIDRNGIKTKYNLEAWEVKQMFEHPALKGKKAKKVKKLSFNFVDDTVLDNPIPESTQTTMDMDELDTDYKTDEVDTEWRNSFE